MQVYVRVVNRNVHHSPLLFESLNNSGIEGNQFYLLMSRVTKEDDHEVDCSTLGCLVDFNVSHQMIQRVALATQTVCL